VYKSHVEIAQAISFSSPIRLFNRHTLRLLHFPGNGSALSPKMNVRMNGSGLVDAATLRSPTKLTHSRARVVQGSGLQSEPSLTKE